MKSAIFEDFYAALPPSENCVLCGHLVIWSFVKIENGWCQNRHYNINIYIYI